MILNGNMKNCSLPKRKEENKAIDTQNKSLVCQCQNNGEIHVPKIEESEELIQRQKDELNKKRRLQA